MLFICHIHLITFNIISATILKTQPTIKNFLFPTIQFSGFASHMSKSFIIHKKINP
jgi:hypothetical protein